MERRHDCGAALARLASQQAQNVELGADVEVGRGLVKQQDLRLLAERPGEKDALALAVAHVGEVASREDQPKGSGPF